MSTPVDIYGWTAVPRDPAILLNGQNNLQNPKPQEVQKFSLPRSTLATHVHDYATRELNEQTFNHSMRVYFYGRHPLHALHHRLAPSSFVSPFVCIAKARSGKAIQSQQFPSWQLDDETYFLACLLHDIGTTDKNLHATLMSFEFYGGFLAHSLLQTELQAPKEQTEGIVEAIIRHQDLGQSGKITTLGQLLQLATVFGL